ncbi:MAG: hypothetical protein R2681_17425 [Pyrinomonadaceae bacterium]
MPADLPQEVLEFIENNSKSVIETEQYIDLFAGAKFRKTLVCRAGVSLNRGLDTDVVKQFFLSSPLRRYTSRAAAADNETVKFVTDSGSVFETDHKLTVTALNRFAVDKSHEIAFEDLVFGSRDELIQKGFSCDDWDSEIATTLSILLQLYAGGLIRFHVARSAALNYVPEKPRISDFARLQASKGGRVPTYHGVNMLLSDDFTKELFVLLDGEKTRDELIAALSAKLYEGNEERSERDAFTEKIAATLDDSLKRMAAIGLLV